jgi:hypothetical protein
MHVCVYTHTLGVWVGGRVYMENRTRGGKDGGRGCGRACREAGPTASTGPCVALGPCGKCVRALGPCVKQRRYPHCPPPPERIP